MYHRVRNSVLATYHNQKASGGPTIITTMQIRSMICISFFTCAPLRDLPILYRRELNQRLQILKIVNGALVGAGGCRGRGVR